MEKLTQLKKAIGAKIQAVDSYVICWSGGKDSTLLVKICNELGHKPPTLVFNFGWHEEQKGVIIGHLANGISTEIFHYRPSTLSYENGAVIAYYNIGNTLLPLVTDHLGMETRCGIELANKALTSGPVPNYIWAVTMLGSKANETHRLVNKLDFGSVKSDTELFTPLWDWTDEEVLEACDILDIRFDSRYGKYEQWIIDSGNFLACMRCVNAHEPVYCFKIDDMTEPVN